MSHSKAEREATLARLGEVEAALATERLRAKSLQTELAQQRADLARVKEALETERLRVKSLQTESAQQRAESARAKEALQAESAAAVGALKSQIEDKDVLLSNAAERERVLRHEAERRIVEAALVEERIETVRMCPLRPRPVRHYAYGVQ